MFPFPVKFIYHRVQKQAYLTVQVFPSLRRVFIPDEWASRPSLREREKRVNELNTVTETVEDEVWTIFNDAEKLQVQMTEKIYAPVNFQLPPGTADITTLHRKCWEVLPDFFFDKVYGSYYDWRSITEFNPGLVASEEYPPVPGNFDLLLPAGNHHQAKYGKSWKR